MDNQEQSKYHEGKTPEQNDNHPNASAKETTPAHTQAMGKCPVAHGANTEAGDSVMEW